MNFGPQSEAVEEVFDFFSKSNRLMRYSGTLNSDKIEITSNPEDILNYVDPPSSAPDETPGWIDIKVLSGTPGYELSRQLFECSNNNKITQNINKSFEELDLFNSILSRIPDTCPDKETVAHVIINDVEWFCLSRAALGRKNEFVELCFSVYNAGLLPCGWNGIYPEGKMVAYYCPQSAE